MILWSPYYRVTRLYVRNFDHGSLSPIIPLCWLIILGTRSRLKGRSQENKACARTRLVGQGRDFLAVHLGRDFEIALVAFA